MNELVIGLNLETISDSQQVFDAVLRKDPDVIVICTKKNHESGLKFAKQAFLSGCDVQLISSVEKSPEGTDWQ